jgi:prolipoprotein diacylglyceryltransferase
MQITIDPVVFYIGSFAVRWYNLILIFSVAVGLVVLLLEAKRLGQVTFLNNTLSVIVIFASAESSL